MEVLAHCRSVDCDFSLDDSEVYIVCRRVFEISLSQDILLFFWIHVDVLIYLTFSAVSSWSSRCGESDF